MNRSRKNAQAGNQGKGQLRIIGGNWRGRKLSFAAAPGLRPTGDRLRETLFNWLAPAISGAHCLDLFAGSGALGLEALSRGAASCDFVDSGTPQIAQIRAHLHTLDALSRGSAHCQQAENFLNQSHSPYDIVFIDPPFNLNLANQICTILAANEHLAADALVYVETAADDNALVAPASWTLHRDKQSGGVGCRLYINSAS